MYPDRTDWPPNKPLQPTSGGHVPGESGSMGRAARG